MNTPHIITIPRRTLLVLCGPAGSGKSTFAAQRFIETTIVSSDRCRAMICDDENNQKVNRETFEVFHMIIQKRLLLERFTVADSTALQPEARRKLRTMSRYYGYFGCLLIFNIPPEVCLERNKSRHRSVEDRVIPYHTDLLQRAILDAPQESWEAIHILDEHTIDVRIEFEDIQGAQHIATNLPPS